MAVVMPRTLRSEASTPAISSESRLLDCELLYGERLYCERLFVGSSTEVVVGLSWITGEGATAGSGGAGSVGAWLTSGAGVSVAGISTWLGLTGVAVSGGVSGTGTVESSGGMTGSSLVAVAGGSSAQALIAGEPIESANASDPATMAAPQAADLVM